MEFNADVDKIVRDAMARAAFVQWYASEEEEAGRSIGGGEDWMDHAPKTSPEAKAWAFEFFRKVEQANNASMGTLVNLAAYADGYKNGADDVSEQYLKDFGHYLAMKGVGHGVGWYDDHEEFEVGEEPFKVPYFDFYD